MHLAPQDNYMSPLLSGECDAILHPGQVPQRGTRAGIQEEGDCIELSLDSGSRPAKRRSSGMTGSANCDIVSKGRTGFCGVKLMVALGIEGLQRLSLIYIGKNLDSDFVACYQFVLTERSFSRRMAQNAILS